MRVFFRPKAIALGAVLLVVPFFQNVQNLATCFTVDSNFALTKVNHPGFQFIQQTQPPWAGHTSLPLAHAFYPATQFTSNDVTHLATAGPEGAGLKQSFWLWANRCVAIDNVTPVSPANPMLGCPNKKVLKGNSYRGMIPVADVAGNVAFDDKGSPEILRPMFSSLQRANTCTVIQASKVMNEKTDSALMQVAQENGLKYVVQPATPWIEPTVQLRAPSSLPPSAMALEQYAARVTVNGNPQTYLLDVCIVEPSGVVGGETNSGITLDYEVRDGRPTAAITSLFDDVKRTFANEKTMKLTVFTSDLASYGPENGITGANFKTVLSHADFIAPLVWTGTEEQTYKFRMIDDLQKQLDIMQSNGDLKKEEFAKILLTMNLHYDDCSKPDNHCAGAMRDIATVRSAVNEKNMGGFIVWKNQATPAGDQVCSAKSAGLPVNQMTACLAFNRCSGDYTAEY